MLGPKTTMNGNFKLEDFTGPLNVNLSSTNISTFISCELFKDKICLNNDLSLSLKLTDDLYQDLAKNRTLLFISGIKAYNPIFINLASEGFYLPIPFDLKALVVPKGTLDMGKILVKNSENISMIIGLMKYHSFLEMGEMNVWCAPVDFRIEGGTLYISRMDLLLADSLHICSFGSIDLISYKVDMLLGITADALEKSFRLSGLSEDYIMEIPLKGNINKLKIDKKFALSKIAELLAPQRGESHLSFKDLFKMFKPESKKIPPPKRPYPWER